MKISLFVVINLICILLHFLFGKILCLWKQLIYMLYFTYITKWMLCFFIPLKIAKYLAQNWSRWQTAHHSCLFVFSYQDNCCSCLRVLACKGKASEDVSSYTNVFEMQMFCGNFCTQIKSFAHFGYHRFSLRIFSLDFSWCSNKIREREVVKTRASYETMDKSWMIALFLKIVSSVRVSLLGLHFWMQSRL